MKPVALQLSIFSPSNWPWSHRITQVPTKSVGEISSTPWIISKADIADWLACSQLDHIPMNLDHLLDTWGFTLWYLKLMIEHGHRNIVDISWCFHQTLWFSIVVSFCPYLWYINYQKVSTKKSGRIGDSSVSQGLEQSHRAACMNRPAFPGWCRWCNFQ